MLSKIKTKLIEYLPLRTIRNLKSLRSRYNFYSLSHKKKIPLPTTAIIDPSNVCNLGCPMCPTGTKKLGQKPVLMKFDAFKKILDRLPSIKQLSLYNWGEPFLNADIFKMIKYAKQKKILVSIHSNFSHKKDKKFFSDLVRSGLDILELSLDGASKKTYNAYRKKGNFDLVMQNLKTLIETQKRLKISSPVIVWKFIVNKHNEKELLLAEEMAKEMDIKFIATTMGLADDLPDASFRQPMNLRKKYWLPINKKLIRPQYAKSRYSLPLYDEPCLQLFTTITINPSGEVLPCCYVTDERNSFGNILKKPLAEIWNNPQFTFSRSLFNKQKYAGPKVSTICQRCHNFKKNPGFQISRSFFEAL